MGERGEDMREDMRGGEETFSFFVNLMYTTTLEHAMILQSVPVRRRILL